MIKKFINFIEPQISKNFNKYPEIRHLTSYESAISILNSGFISSRNELKNKNIDIKEINEKWENKRKNIEQHLFENEDLIYCVPDWFNDSGYETGHGSVMIYFKPNIFEDFHVTFTLLDSIAEKNTILYDKHDLHKIYNNILTGKFDDYTNECCIILENLNKKNKAQTFNTTKGNIYIDGDRFYNKYSEIQIHSNNIPLEYIQEIRLTDNYFYTKDNDYDNKLKLISLCNEKNIKI